MDTAILIFKALSDKTRLRILKTLQHAGKELCICELMDTLELAQYNISRHMRELKLAGLVQERKEGKFVFYCLKPASDALLIAVNQAITATAHEDTSDISRLKGRLKLRKDGKCVVGIRKTPCCTTSNKG